VPQFYAPIDLLRNELRNAILQNLAAAPSNPNPGQQYFNTATSTMYYWSGTAWVPMTAAAGGPPTGPAGGDLGGAYPDPSVVRASNGFSVLAGRTTFPAATTQANSVLFGASPVGIWGQGGTSLMLEGNVAVNGGTLSLSGSRILSVATPTADTDAANKAYVDGLVSGLTWKATCRVATTANITLSGTQTIDGVAVVAGNRVLVKNQTAASANGIYVAAATGWSRAPDVNTGDSLVNAAAFVSEGTTQADTAWVVTTNAPITIGTTAITWVQFGAGAVYAAGNGLMLTGNVFAVDTAVIATVASLSGYVPTSRQILNGTGITGGGNLTADRTLAVDTTVVAPTARLLNTTAPLTGGGNLTADRTLGISAFAGSAAGAVPASAGGTANFLRADGQWAAPPMPAAGVAKYAAALAGTGSPETVTHNLNTRDVQVQVINGASPYTAVEVDWDATTVNTVTIRYNPNLGAGYRVVVMG
jgi:hypothetical protein